MTDYEREWNREAQSYRDDPEEGWDSLHDDVPYADSDPRLDAWTAFRAGEQVDDTQDTCTECHRPIPEEDDVIEWADGTGRICEACAAADEQSQGSDQPPW